MNTAAKGRRNEHRSMAIYRALGFEVLRSAGSKGAWDFVAISGHNVVLVQVKSGAWPGPAERAKLAAFRTPLNCNREIHRWRPNARRPDIRVWNGVEWRDEFANAA
jgi:hypothetical protein